MRVPATAGIATAINLDKKPQAANYGLEFIGVVQAAAEGLYTFYTNSDDGSKLFIDDVMIVDNDGNHGPRERSGVVRLAVGWHHLKVVYYQGEGGEALSASWEGPGQARAALSGGTNVGRLLTQPAVFRGTTMPGLQAKYYETATAWTQLPNFAALAPTATSVVQTISTAPAGARANNYGLEFVGFFEAGHTMPDTNTYSFSLTSDDGSRLLIDGVTVIDNDFVHGPQTETKTVRLAAGFHTFKVQYFQGASTGTLSLRYTPPGGSDSSIPMSAFSYTP
jgi:hypothetical protein